MSNTKSSNFSSNTLLLLAKTAKAAVTGRYKPFKTTSIFDGTAQNPQWLDEEPPAVQQLMQA